jgi:protein-tyrosine-phosphatase
VAEVATVRSVSDTRSVFRVCFVCTGNRCRSPVAAGVFESLTAGLDAEVVSAGTLSGGHPSPGDTVLAAREIGIHLSDHRSRAVSDTDLSHFDLVIGFEFDHVAAAVVDGGARREVTFGLTEIVDLVGEIEPPEGAEPIARASFAIKAADELRGDELPRIRPIADPYGLPLSQHRRMVAEVSELCGRLAHRLFGP